MTQQRERHRLTWVDRHSVDGLTPPFTHAGGIDRDRRAVDQLAGDLFELVRADGAWHGAVTVPAGAPGNVRLLIEEVETYQTVDGVTGDLATGDRVVFAETYLVG